MDENLLDSLDLKLTESARHYLEQGLASLAKNAKGRILSLTYSGGMQAMLGGKPIWEYKGPNFLLACGNADRPRPGKYYDLLGVRVLIGEVEELLLRNQTLTVIQYGEPVSDDLLVIENAPENYFELRMRERGCCNARFSKDDQNSARTMRNP